MTPSGKAAAPRLRSDLEIIPTVYRGTKAFVVRDFLGLIGTPMIFRREAAALLGLLDGRRSVQDIQVEFIRLSGGTFVSSDDIRNLVAELDSALVLDTPRFRRARERLKREYAQQALREPVLAGNSYPKKPEELNRALDAILAGEGDPSSPAAGPAPVCALVAPHIELENGKSIYGRAYQAVRGLKPRLVVLLGTGHSLEGGYFSVTEKDFETPLGTARTDRETVRELREAGGKAVAPYDISHRREHSLEFQLVFLQRIFGPDFSIVPVLCGSFDGELSSAARPADIPGVGAFLQVLRNISAGPDGGVLFVAGIDFSHIGPKFGHKEKAVSLLLEARKHDQALIEAACGGNVPAFWAEVARVKNRYNVCGFSTLASLLEIISPAEGVNLGYEFWQEEATHSAVSYAALAFSRP